MSTNLKIKSIMQGDMQNVVSKGWQRDPSKQKDAWSIF